MEQEKTTKEKPVWADCPVCGDAVDLSSKKKGEKIECPHCKDALVVIEDSSGFLEIEALA